MSKTAMRAQKLGLGAGDGTWAHKALSEGDKRRYTGLTRAVELVGKLGAEKGIGAMATEKGVVVEEPSSSPSEHRMKLISQR